MAKTKKMTFTLDDQTAKRIDRTARRLGLPKSRVVREAVREYAARAGSLSEDERVRMLNVFDDVVARVPKGSAAAVDREIAAVRKARQEGGPRKSPKQPR